MKKIIFGIILLCVTASMYAQTTYKTTSVEYDNNNTYTISEDGNTVVMVKKTDTPISRYGNRYTNQTVTMNNRQFLNFLKNSDCTAAYQQCKNGYNMAVAGWCCMGAGLGIYIVNYGIMLGSLDCNRWNISVMCLAGALELVSIPTLAVGYTRMHQAANIYNISCSHKTPERYWSLEAGQNGIGIAYNF